MTNYENNEKADAMKQPRERFWQVDGLTFAGLEWGDGKGTPVLALHGWMDHAASFCELAPRLVGCNVLAIDLSGHGLSDNRADHATYNIWDDLPQINALLDQVGWDDCVLLGHSRGAIIGSLFAATLPERVRALVALDALLPEPSTHDAVTTLRAFVQQTGRQKTKPARVFSSKEEYVARRASQGNSEETARGLAERALEAVTDGFRMRGDARLFASSAVKLKADDLEVVLQSIAAPVLNIWAEAGIRKARLQTEDMIRQAKLLVADYETVSMPGDHHFHMDGEIAAGLAARILVFLEQRGKL